MSLIIGVFLFCLAVCYAITSGWWRKSSKKSALEFLFYFIIIPPILAFVSCTGIFIGMVR